MPLPLYLALAFQAAGCGPLMEAEPPERGESFLYETIINGETSDLLMQHDIVAGRDLAITFYQGGGFSRDDIFMNRQAPVRGFGGIAFVRSLGTGPRRREFSYSPSPDEVLARLEPGQNEDVYVHERSGGAGERYRLTVSFDRCEPFALGDETLPANVYTITRDSGDDGEGGTRELWLSSASGWWLMENHPERHTLSRLIEAHD
ncbi:hypothetical protein V0U79_05460 [Hyphobacterium sp. HN65]|uniref:YjbF family lipoprotein n=1 Tax=Hyphobacterium lacteum TaxID=3116575 RepID=A0ABU7LPG0_9PROT|nr:hypothetical protein [Hyphobacterium sp. HN65]MEE2525806.1 hypothetical protein [Hyphobacterium sp. HN65]